ncbi:PIG-L family deacetylase [Granulicoccus sp. GXG6511]|uniref:PIG-L family deacetylase n=1 Tax=Granulicoccus sp. GXG6511 TaxID=3381351 RepID=UPI003D7DAEC8
MSLFDGARRVLFVHAHPDDETLATGALIAWLVAEGVECRVLTATRGERGELVAGRFPEAPSTGSGSFGEWFVERRLVELTGALRELGAGEPMFLGEGAARADGLAPRRYEDSGMRWVREGLAGPAEDSGPESLTAADPEEAVADLVTGIRAIGPDVVVTYDDAGGYGHPDHVRVHELTVAACARLGVPLLEILSDAEAEGEWHDLTDWHPKLTAALEHHQTQITVDGRHVIHSGGQREPMQLWIGVRRSEP